MDVDVAVLCIYINYHSPVSEVQWVTFTFTCEWMSMLQFYVFISTINTDLKQEWLLAFGNKIQTRKRLKRGLFIMAKHILPSKVLWSELFLLPGCSYLEPTPCFCPPFYVCQLISNLPWKPFSFLKNFFSLIAPLCGWCCVCVCTRAYVSECACACVFVCVHVVCIWILTNMYL